MGAAEAVQVPPVKPGRPAGEVYLKLLQVSHSIRLERAESGQGATLRELAERGCVGFKAARLAVGRMRNRGQLDIVGWRKVDYRNRPVAEYAPMVPSLPDGADALAYFIAGWAR
ncbi:MAG: hypothetical protein Q8R67_04495 [Rhodoferax sp.]|nr:hypothetical protein [Rhodoferax sp.]MDP3650925.1 hypothetical protein [Rhodoferax sp.]